MSNEWIDPALELIEADADKARTLGLFAIAAKVGEAVEQLSRLNEGRDQWYREVLEVLSAAKDSEGSPVGSGQPAAAPDGHEGGK